MWVSGSDAFHVSGQESSDWGHCTQVSYFRTLYGTRPIKENFGCLDKKLLNIFLSNFINPSFILFKNLEIITKQNNV